MRRTLATCAWLCAAAIAAPAALAQSGAPASSDFRSLWTGWRDVNRSSLATEQRSADQVRQTYVEAGSRQRERMHNEGRALGERVGEVVRLGDCEEGERLARAAGDFALVEAVRAHCRASEPAPQR